MLNKALLLAASQSGTGAAVKQPYSRFKISFALDEGTIGCVKVGEDQLGTFELLSGSDLVLEDYFRVFIVNEVNGETTMPLLAMCGLPVPDGEMAICRVVNETTGQTLYGIASSDGGVGFMVFVFQTRSELMEALQSGADLPNPPHTMFTEDDVGKEFTLSIYIEGYESGPNGPYSQYDITVGCEDEEPTEASAYGAVRADGVNELGTVKHVSGESLAITTTDENGVSHKSEIFASFLGGINVFMFPLDMTATSPGIVKYVDETNGNAGYGVYGVAEDSLLGDGSVMAWFATKEDAQTFIATGSTDHMEAVSAPLFTKDNIGETHRLSFYLEDSGVEPYSRFSVVSGYDQNSTSTVIDYGYRNDSSKAFGEFTLLGGKDLATNDANGNPAIRVFSSGTVNLITCPDAETKNGICKVVNETTGVEAYGYFGEKLNYAKPYYFWVAFKTYDDVQKFVNDDDSFEYADVFFTADNVGVEQTFSIYILEYLNGEGGDSGGDSGDSEPEVTPPIEPGTHEFEFKASANASGVNFFTNVSSTAHPSGSFEVAINDETSSMDYTSLSFSSGDRVKIVGENVISFPTFNAKSKNFISEVLTPLPFMSDGDGNALLELDSTFYNCSTLSVIPEDLFVNNTEVEELPSTFYACSKLTDLPEGLLSPLVDLKTFDHTFLGCGFTSIPDGFFANNKKLKNMTGCFQNGKFTSIPENLFANNTEITSFSKVFCGSRIQSIPESLFVNNTNALSFYWSFWNCSSLASIPSGLFEKNTKVTDFDRTFEGCSKITEIPTNLFSKNTRVTTFQGTFSKCTRLLTIDEGLFSKNTAVRKFGGVFSGCTSLTSIPENVFANNTMVTDFVASGSGGAFQGCTGITSIPANLFSRNVSVTSFGNKYYGGVFSGCTGITSVPENLFANNTEVKDFTAAFSGCTNLSGRIKIGSAVVESAASFCEGCGSITVVVPAGSTTETTFRAVAETLTNLTVETY